MQLIIQCHQCGKPLTIPLPADTSEQEAARIAQDVRCADCLRAMPSAEQIAPRGEQQATAGSQGEGGANEFSFLKEGKILIQVIKGEPSYQRFQIFKK